MAESVQDRPVLLVLASTYPRWAGDTEPGFVHELSRRLTDRFEVIVVTPHAPGAVAREVLDGVTICRYRYAPQQWQTLVHGGGMVSHLKRSPWKFVLLPGFVLGQYLLGRQLVRAKAPTVIHAHWLLPQGLVARLLAMQRLPYLVTSHGADLFALRSSWFARLRRWVVAGAGAVSVVSVAMRDRVRQESPVAEVRVLPMGVDTRQRFTPDAAAPRQPDELLFVGRLVEKKGLRYLIEALPVIREARPGVRLNIAGAGPERQALEARVVALGLSEQVSFLGAVTQPELPALYRRASLFVAPFVEAAGGDQEGLGLVVAEAMACECPVLVGNVAAVHDLVDASTGWLAPASDVSALAVAVLKALGDSTESTRRAIRARQKVVNDFDWERVAERYGRLLATLSTSPLPAR